MDRQQAIEGRQATAKARRPNFFIVGAPKAGTTSMYSYLAQHPDIFLCPVKEPNHFASGSILRQRLYYDARVVENDEEYLSLFETVTHESAVGEASVSYLFYEEACRRIAGFDPAANILVFLRNPVDRAFSHYMMDRRLGLVSADFDEVIASGGESEDLALHYQQYVSLGMYASQLERYRQAFGDHVCVTLFSDLRADPLGAARRVFAHLGVDDAFTPDVGRVHNPYREPRNRAVANLYGNARLRAALRRLLPAGAVTRVKSALLPAGDKPSVSPGCRRRLVEIFEADIRRLETMIDRSLEHWLNG